MFKCALPLATDQLHYAHAPGPSWTRPNPFGRGVPTQGQPLSTVLSSSFFAPCLPASTRTLASVR